MSKKNKNNTKSKLIPELRFPEFKDKPQWEVKTIGEVSFVNMGQSPKSAFYNTEAEGLPLIQGNADIQNRLSAPKVYTSQITKQCQTGDLLISVRAPVGTIAKSAHNACIGRGIAAIRAKENTAQEFLYQFFFKFESSWDSISQGGTFDAINRDALLQLPLPLPSLAEQERIGALFSTLDSLIQAQSKEVQLLRLRKKGLMQKMFPYEGETTPEWRFPEFNDAPEWEVKTIGEVMSYANGLAHEQFVCPDGRYTIVNSKFISSDGKVSKFTNNPRRLAKKDDILMVLSDVPAGKALAKCLLINKDNTYTVNQRICILSSKVHNSTFLYYSLNRNRYFLRFDDKKKQTNLRKVEIVSCPLPIPSLAEQKRIGALFSTLDSLIEAKSQRLEQLKNHKKGLMQQLFP